MLEICTNSPLPELEDLRKEFNKYIKSLTDQFPNFSELIAYLRKFDLRALAKILPTVLDDIYAGYSNITEEIGELLEGIKTYQDIITMNGIFQPIVDLLGGVIDDFVPPIPVINIPFTVLLRMDAEKIYEAVKAAMQLGIEFPDVPKPIYIGLENKSKELVFTVKAIIVNYKKVLIETMQEMIKSALEKLEISAILPLLVDVPSIQDVIDLILSFFPEYQTIYEIMINTGKTIEDLLKMTGLMLPTFEPVMIPFFSNFAIEIVERIKQVIDFITSFNILKLLNFCVDTLGQLGFEFPTFCFTIGV